MYADDRRFFGLVTSQSREGEASVSSSCHVFMVEPVTSQQERIQVTRGSPPPSPFGQNKIVTVQELSDVQTQSEQDHMIIIM